MLSALMDPSVYWVVVAVSVIAVPLVTAAALGTFPADFSFGSVLDMLAAKGPASARAPEAVPRQAEQEDPSSPGSAKKSKWKKRKAALRKAGSSVGDESADGDREGAEDDGRGAPSPAPVPVPALDVRDLNIHRIDTALSPTQCDNEGCKSRLLKLESVLHRNTLEINRLRQNNKEYVIQSSSQMLVHAIQNRRRLSENSDGAAELSEDDEKVSLSMTLDGDGGGPLTPRNDMVADILETPRGRREWQEYRASAERVQARDAASALEERCRALEEERERMIAAHLEEKNDLQKELDEVTKARTDYDTRLTQSCAELSKYQNKCDDLVSQLSKLHAERATVSNAGLDRLQEQLAALQDADERWRMESEEKVKLAKELQEVIRDHDELKREFSALRNALTDMESSSSGAAVANDWTEEQLMEIEAYQELSAKWRDLELDYAKLQTESEEQNEQAEQTIQSLNAMIEESETARKELEAEMGRLRRELAALEEDRSSSASREREGLLKELSTLRAEASRGASLLEEAERRAAQLQARLHESSRDYESRLEEAQGEKAALLNEYDSASLNLTELDRGMSALQAAFEESQQEKAALSAELEKAEKRVALADAQREAAVRLDEQHRRDKEIWTKAEADYRAQLSSLRDELASTSEKHREDMASYRRVQQRLEDFDEDYARLQQDCDDRLEVMQRENEILMDEIRVSAQKRRDLDSELASVRRKLRASEQKCADLTEALEEEEKRGAERDKADAATRLQMDQQYTYLVKEYEERLQDLEKEREDKEEELSTLREQLQNNEVLTKLLREELQACERQVIGLEMTRESDYVSGELSEQLSHCASDLGTVTKEISRYKGLYGDSLDTSDWGLSDRMPDLERDSLDFSSGRADWDGDAADDSSDSLDHPFSTGLALSTPKPLARENHVDVVVPFRRPSPDFRTFDVKPNGSPSRTESPQSVSSQGHGTGKGGMKRGKSLLDFYNRTKSSNFS